MGSLAERGSLPSQQGGYKSFVAKLHDFEDDFSCRTDCTTVQVSNVRRITLSLTSSRCFSTDGRTAQFGTAKLDGTARISNSSHTVHIKAHCSNQFVNMSRLPSSNAPLLDTVWEVLEILAVPSNFAVRKLSGPSVCPKPKPLRCDFRHQQQRRLTKRHFASSQPSSYRLISLSFSLSLVVAWHESKSGPR